MADEQTTPVQAGQPGVASIAGSAPVTPPVAPVNPDVEAKLKKLEELEKTNAQLAVIANTVYYDEDLRSKFEEKYAQLNGEKKPEQKVEAPAAKTDEYKALEQKVSTLESKSRVEVISDFEKKNGIDQLEEDKRKEVKAKIAAKLTEWGHSVANTSVDQLSGLMEDAYRVSYGEEIAKKKAAKEFQNQNGMFGSFSAGSAPMGDDVEITQGQAYWISKFGLAPDKVKKTLSEHQ